MNAIDITFVRALKVWWSLAWRVIVLVMPVLVVTLILLMLLTRFTRLGHSGVPLPPDQIRTLTATMPLAWLFMMTLSIFMHAQATRWMLKTRWSDFRLVAVANESDSA